MNTFLRSALISVLLAILLNGQQSSVSAQGPLGLLRTILQNNIAGAPVNHKVTEWDFDPEVSMKRRQQFYELHGYRGEKLIERLGLGIDGHAEQRLAQQRIRDDGKLGGLLDVPN